MYENLKPTGLDKKIFDKLIEAWKSGMSDREALFYACPDMSITLDDLQKMYIEKPDLIILREGLKGKLVTKARKVVKEAIDKGNEKTARWYLEKKVPDEFGAKAQIEVQQPINVSLADKRKEMEEFMEKFTNEG